MMSRCLGTATTDQHENRPLTMLELSVRIRLSNSIKVACDKKNIHFSKSLFFLSSFTYLSTKGYNKST